MSLQWLQWLVSTLLLTIPLVIILGSAVATAQDTVHDPQRVEKPEAVEPLDVEPVVVAGTRIEATVPTSAANVTVLSRDDLARTGALVVDDYLRQIPGFNTFRRSSSLVTAPAQDPEAQGVTLRGIGPGGASRALILLDGIPVNDGYGGWIYWGQLPIEQIERIEIVRGGYSSLWGNYAMGGVINIVTRSLDKSEIRAKAQYGNRNTGEIDLGITQRWDKVRFRVDGGFFHTDGWNIIDPSQRGPLDRNSDSERKRIGGRVEYDLTPDFKVFAQGGFYQEDRNTGTLLRTSDTNRSSFAGGARYRSSEGSLWELKVFSYQTRFNEHFWTVNDPRTFETPRQFQQVPSTDTGGSFTWTKAAFGNHVFLAGGDVRWIRGEGRDQFFDPTGAFSGIQVNQGRQLFTGIFVQDIYEPTDRLNIVTSVRGDYIRNYGGQLLNTPIGLPATLTHFQTQDKLVVNPRLGVRYQVTNGVALRGAAYRAFRAPTLSELYRESSVEGLLLRSNPSLSPEFLEGGEIGFDVSLIPRVTLKVTGYWNNLKRPIGNIASAKDPLTGEDTERIRANIGQGRVRGIEVDASFQIAQDWSLTASYLYTEAKVIDNPADPDLIGKRLAQVPWHSATIGLRYANSRLLNALVQLRYSGKQFEDADNRDELRQYAVVDLFLSRALPQVISSRTAQPGEIFLVMQNLFNRHYDIDLGGGILKLGTPFLLQTGIRMAF